MIRVEPAREPDDFDDRVRQPGARALRARRKDLPTHWRRCLPQLRAAYDDTCACLGMRIHPATGAATVDHFVPKSKTPKLAYEWSNFRLAAQAMNTNKGAHRDVLDPFVIQDGWFVLDVGTFKVLPGPGLGAARRKQIRETIDRLKLNDATFCQAREEYHDRYLGLAEPVRGAEREPLPFSWLRAECPFVASELARLGRLREKTA